MAENRTSNLEVLQEGLDGNRLAAIRRFYVGSKLFAALMGVVLNSTLSFMGDRQTLHSKRMRFGADGDRFGAPLYMGSQ